MTCFDPIEGVAERFADEMGSLIEARYPGRSVDFTIATSMRDAVSEQDCVVSSGPWRPGVADERFVSELTDVPMSFVGIVFSRVQNNRIASISIFRYITFIYIFIYIYIYIYSDIYLLVNIFNLYILYIKSP